jgi:glycosyltransferase involved in cell wall biosynthesis
LRIAIVIDSIIRGGSERQALTAARALAQRGCDVELIYYHARAESHYDLSLAGGARVIYLEKGGRPLRFLLRLRDRLARGGFHVVHSFKSSPCIYGGLAAWLAGVPVILGGLRGGEYVDRGPMRLGHRVLSRLQTGWIVNSEAIVDELVRAIRADRTRCFVVGNGIDAEAFRSPLSKGEAKARLGIDPGTSTVSIVALLRPEKNHEMFLNAAARVVQSHPKTQFLVVGDGPERATIEARIAELGLEAQVRLLGVRSDVADLLAASDVSVLTSAYEGLSNSLMEAMCAGVAVVSTSYAGVEQLVTDGHDGCLVPRGDAQALSHCLCRLLGDPGERERLGRNALRTIQTRYGIDAMASGLLAVYEDRLRHAKRGRAASPISTT